MPKLAVYVRAHVKPGQRDAARAVWEKHLQPRAAANPVQETYYFCYDENPDVFVLFEVYTDPAQMDANAQTDWFAAYMEEIGPLLAGPPHVHKATPVWVKGED